MAGEGASFLGGSDSLARLSFGLFLAGGTGTPPLQRALVFSYEQWQPQGVPHGNSVTKEGI